MAVTPAPAMARAVSTVLTGAALGLILLGIGGRLAMHGIAIITTGRGGFTLGGTLTVVALGGLSGVTAGLILAVARLLLHRWYLATSTAYWGLLAVLVLHGLRPIDPLRLLWFLPLTVIFGIILQWITWPGRHHRPLDLTAARPRGL